MGITIAELNQKYLAEDKGWDFSLFPAWLQKKGIPNTPEMPIVAVTLEQVLIEFSPGTLPATHDEFDKKVFQMALANKMEGIKAINAKLEEQVQASLKKHLAGNRWGKVWRALRGKI